MKRSSAILVAAVTLIVAVPTAAWAEDDPTYPDQGEAEGFSSPEVDRLRARVSEYDDRHDRLETEIERLRDEGALKNHQQVGALEGEQRSFASDWGRAEEDLAEARLGAIHDAPVQGLPAQQVDGLETKRDALEALSDWAEANVGMLEPVQERVREELYAVEDELEGARQAAALQEERRQEQEPQRGSSQQQSSSAAGGSGSSAAQEDGSGGINPVPFALLLGVLGGSAYYAARRIGWKPGSGTPLAPPPVPPRVAEPSAGTGVEPPPTDSDPMPRRGVPEDAGPEPEERQEPSYSRHDPSIFDDDEPPPGGWGDEPEDDDRASEGGCPSCGAPVGARARFCTKCGHGLGRP